jgi:hypothetical protein
LHLNTESISDIESDSKKFRDKNISLNTEKKSDLEKDSRDIRDKNIQLAKEKLQDKLQKKSNKSNLTNSTPTTREPSKRQKSAEYKQKIYDFLDTKNYDGNDAATIKRTKALPDVKKQFPDYLDYFNNDKIDWLVWRYFVDKNKSQNEEIFRLQELAGLKK